MTFIQQRAALLAPAVGALVLLAGANEPARKCGTTVDPGTYHIAIDGVISVVKSADPLKHLNRDDIHSVEVLCMNPQDSTFNRSQGIPVVSVWTIKGPVSELKGTLTAMIKAQDEHYQRNAQYADDIAAMQLPATTAKLRISVAVYERGWIARGTMDRFMATCVVLDGTIPAESPVLEPRQVRCR